ncbi:MAG: GreA/GreB family elongation factor [Clostridia bacterium]|nr:GreA/GreB family elongation factor [Clostridia bacterium]
MHDELTKVDIEKMQAEIDERIARRAALRETIRAAKELGDLSENDEYHSARREFNKNNGRIEYLQSMIETAVVIDGSSADDEIGLFDTVELYIEEDDETRTITLVTTLRQDAIRGFVSKESPLGQAILGHKTGERVTVKVNDKYSYDVIIRSIKKGQDDRSLPISEY